MGKGTLAGAFFWVREWEKETFAQFWCCAPSQSPKIPHLIWEPLGRSGWKHRGEKGSKGNTLMNPIGLGQTFSVSDVPLSSWWSQQWLWASLGGSGPSQSRIVFCHLYLNLQQGQVKALALKQGCVVCFKAYDCSENGGLLFHFVEGRTRVICGKLYSTCLLVVSLLEWLWSFQITVDS